MIQRLPKPQDDVVQAFTRLNDNIDFVKIMKYLEFSSAFIVEKFKASKVSYDDILNKGALQVIDDLREIDAHAVEWQGAILALKTKKKGGLSR